MSNTNGRNWIWPATRLAIYLRDGLACLWCGKGVEQDVQLTLDHFEARASSEKPDHSATNLFTSCCSCNSRRQHLDATTFAGRLSTLPELHISKIQSQCRAPLKEHRNKAKELLKGRKWQEAVSAAHIRNKAGRSDTHPKHDFV